MGPKKKGKDDSEEAGKPKNSKLNKMNEMDRVKYLERRMAEEQEGKKRKEEMVAGYLRLKLDHEERSVTLNRFLVTCTLGPNFDMQGKDHGPVEEHTEEGEDGGPAEGRGHPEGGLREGSGEEEEVHWRSPDGAGGGGGAVLNGIQGTDGEHREDDGHSSGYYMANKSSLLSFHFLYAVFC